MLVSLVALIGLFVGTFAKHGGFAHSITFDGGIRFSLLMPPGTGKTELEKGLRQAGFGSQDVQVRLANFKSNKFDLEFGPNVEQRLRKQEGLDNAPKTASGGPAAKAATPKAPAPKADNNEELPKKKTVVDVIEEKLLAQLPYVTSDNIVAREAISASYGGNLAKVAIYSLIWVILIIGIYLSFRFDFPYAIGASLALLHDVFMAVGFIGVMQIEPSIPVVAAVLTIIGYSINDTIVIFDRIRENMEDRTNAVIAPAMDLAITQTLSRTIVTSLLTLLAVLALLFGGAESLYDFALVLCFGIVVGTYSSVFIASHFVQYYQNLRARVR